MRKFPIGISDFKRMIERDYVYVDKTLFIKELMDQGAQALLIPRPRRFGKTLNLSMLRYFFEKTEEDHSHLFRGLKIWQAGAEYRKLQGKFPVIFLTFKDVKETDWATAEKKLKRLLQAEFLRHGVLRENGGLSGEDLEYYNEIVGLKADTGMYEDSLRWLSHQLMQYYQRSVILLIDEYDTPIQAGYLHGYYPEVISFMRNFLSGGLKDNPALEKGVLTGIMRVAKESIFSGLNNLGVYTLLSRVFADKFGLTEAEVQQMTKELGLEGDYERLNEWYNGYVFGDRVVYNPWSIINYLNSPADGFKPYWVNTSDNAIVERLLTRGGSELKEELESLLRGEAIEKPIEENIVFADLETRDELLWSFLLFGGYLKYVSKRENGFRSFYELRIPNREVGYVFHRIVERWFEPHLERRRLEALLKALREGDVKLFERFFRELVKNIFSYHDFSGEPEKVYHAFCIGLLVWMGNEYEIRSNRESGYGRYDVMIIPRDSSRIGYVIEFKTVDTYEDETVDIAFEKAFYQIEERQYDSELISRGVRSIKKLAIVFEGKQVWVREQ